MEKWTQNNIPNLKGKTIIVTGGTSGLGFEAVRLFAKNGADVILTARKSKEGELAKKRITSNLPKAKIQVMELELGDLESIKKFTKDYKKKHKKLDVLLNNAGIMWCPYSKTKDGFESQMGVNHLGHFALTGLLLDVLKKTNKARVVNVSSLGHRRAKLDLDNLLFSKENYNPNLAYFNSKLANLLFTYELQRRFEKNGLDIISVAAHPGGSNTNLAKYIEKKWYFKLLKPLFLLLAQSASIGTLPEVRASTDPKVQGSDYYGPRGFNEMGGYPILVKSTKESHNRVSAKKLWELSEKLTKIRFDFK